jgi:hypothetical protein
LALEESFGESNGNGRIVWNVKDLAVCRIETRDAKLVLDPLLEEFPEQKVS